MSTANATYVPVMPARIVRVGEYLGLSGKQGTFELRMYDDWACGPVKIWRIVDSGNFHRGFLVGKFSLDKQHIERATSTTSLARAYEIAEYIARS